MLGVCGYFVILMNMIEPDLKTWRRWGCLLCLLVNSFTLPLLAEPDPSGAVPPLEMVQARIWKNLRLQEFTLDGLVRVNREGEKKDVLYPIILRTKGHEMVYEFKEQRLQIRVCIDSDHSTIEKRAKPSEPWAPVQGKERLKTILTSDITYEDLAMDFIRWDKIKVLGTDDIKTLPAWAFEAVPNGISSYTKARYWISSQYYAFLRVDGYNKQNQVIKRVEVNGVQKIGNAYVIKEMQISSLIPGRDISSCRSYVEIHSGKPGSGN